MNFLFLIELAESAGYNDRLMIPLKYFQSNSSARTAFILAVLLVVMSNVLASFKDLRDLHVQRQKIPYFFSGYIFSGLEGIFKKMKYVSYYTDKSMDSAPYAAQFAQAQYVLAPAVLDLNNTGHEFILFDYIDEKKAFKKMKELKAIPLKRNKFGIILARVPPKNLPQENHADISQETSWTEESAP